MPQPSVTFRISVDPALVPDGDVQRLLDALENFAPLLEELGDIMSEAQQENFASQGTAFGQPWAALAPSTLGEKARRGFSSEPMVRTGALRDAAGQFIAVDGGEGGGAVETGFDLNAVPYAQYHQPSALGGSNSGEGRLPTRILVSFSPQEKEQMLQAVQDYLDQQAGGISGVSITMEEV